MSLLTLAACGGRTSEEAASSGSSSSEKALSLGQQVYTSYCVTCHQANGQGIPGAFPPLTETEWTTGDEGRLIRLVLDGMRGPIEVNGSTYNNLMKPHGFLSDDQIAAVLTYVRQSFGNDAGAVTPEAVAAVRTANEQEGTWEASALKEATGIPETEARSEAAAE